MANATTFLLCCQGKDWLFPGSQKEGAWIWENPGEKRRKTICGVSLSPQLDGFERSTVMTSCRAPTVIGQRRWKCYKRCHSQSNKNTFTIVIKNALNFELVLRSFSLAIFHTDLLKFTWNLSGGRIFRFFTDLSGLTLGRFFLKVRVKLSTSDESVTDLMYLCFIYNTRCGNAIA